MKIAYASVDASCWTGHTNRDASPGYPSETLLREHPFRDKSPMRIGYIISDGPPPRPPLVQVGQYIGEGSINQAEYLAVIHALRHAARLEFDRIELTTDSQLIHRQVMGRYRVKVKALLPLYREVINLGKFFTGGVGITWVKREQNLEADGLTRRTEMSGPMWSEGSTKAGLIARWMGQQESLNYSVAGRILDMDVNSVWLMRAGR